MNNITGLTSNFEDFKKQVDENSSKLNFEDSQNKIIKIRKNLILSFISDSAGCGHIRNILPMTYLNSVFGKTRQLHPVALPFFIFEPDILLRTRSLFFQRVMSQKQLPIILKYKELQDKYKFKMIYDLDDFIFKGKNIGECIPEYNFGSKTFSEEMIENVIKIMNLMDVVCVSTDFLKKYLKEKIGIKTEIKVVPNSIPHYFYGPKKKQPIKEKIKIPKVIWTGSPTHYMDSNYIEKNGQKITVFPVYTPDMKIAYYKDKKGTEKYNIFDVKNDHQKGDWDNAWCEWVIKSVKDKKIKFLMMGTPKIPFFFKELTGNEYFKIIGWQNTFQYNMPILDYSADIGIAPLVPNYFNYSKSDIKMIEYYASGSVAVGTIFSNGMPSPYDNCFNKLSDTCSVEDIEEWINIITEPEIYNKTIEKQYNYLIENNRYLESPGYINNLCKIL